MKESTRERIPGFLKSIYRFAVVLARYPLSRFRALPNFIIIGVQKGGTSTLFELLKQHPLIKTSVFKEVHYYDFQYSKGKSWYRSFFPLFKKRKDIVYGEASPYYFFHPSVPERIYKDNPDIKLILLLRDPAVRAYSHYQMEKRKGREKLPSFEEAISKETERMQTGAEALAQGKNHLNHHVYSYVARGCYDEQMKRWLHYFAPHQILLLKSEDFFASPHLILEKIYRFLNVPVIFPNNLLAKNQGSYHPLDSETIERLRDYYQPHNTELSRLVGEEFQWT